MRRVKTGRYVHTPEGLGIIFKIHRCIPLEEREDEKDLGPCRNIQVHLLDEKGETRKEVFFNITDTVISESPLSRNQACRMVAKERGGV